jgi:hypothetical protein
MGAKAGRKGGRTYNLLTCGVSGWRKYLDKTRRKAAKAFAIEEQEWDRPCVEHSDPTCRCDEAGICGWVRPGEYWCHCGTSECRQDSVDNLEAEHGEADTHPDTQVARQTRGEDPEQGT